MALNLDAKKAAQIDSEIWNIYKGRLGGNELPQLAKLFKENSLPRSLAKVLSQSLPRPSSHYREELEIKLAWIDKRPLAKLEAYTKRGELGDAAIFFFDLAQSGKTRYRQARALILQAKVAEEAKQLAHPTVPVNPTNPSKTSSTARELALLSKWDRFDLYKASRSRVPIADRIAIISSTTPSPNGWYMATPKKQPNPGTMAAWKCPWMCAPAEKGSSCNVTFGNLLWAFLSSNLVNSTYEVGANFNFDPEYLIHPQGRDWTRLCIELLRLCPENDLPQSLFGRRPKRAIVSSVIRSLPYLGSEGGLTNLFSWLRDLVLPRRMPVLFVMLIRREGEMYE
jgi:hypothetical protein